MKRNLLFSQATALGKTLGKRLVMVLTMLLIVGIGQAWGYTGTFTLVESYNSSTGLENGYYVITASPSASTIKAMGTTISSGRATGQTVSISNKTITNPADAIVWYIEKSGSTYSFKNVNDNKYIYQSSTSRGKGLNTSTTKQSSWSIETYNSTSPVGFRFTSSQTSNNYLKWNNSSSWFSTYQSGYSTSMAPVALYKLNSATKTLSSISVSGQTTSYNVGDDFSFDGICTAKYSDNSTKTVTPSVSTPDMNSAGNKTVTVSYTEGGITVNATYTITVSAPAGGGGDGDCDRWVEVSLSDIQSTDDVVIAMEKSNLIYALTYNSATATSKAPPATLITNDNLKTNSGIANTLRWNISNSNGNLTIYPTGSISTWLYCTNTNNGVLVGTNENKAFAIDNSSGYLKHIGTSRYIGVYFNQDTGNAQDWRCYTSTTSNISGQTLKFYKYVECTAETTVFVIPKCGGDGGGTWLVVIEWFATF